MTVATRISPRLRQLLTAMLLVVVFAVPRVGRAQSAASATPDGQALTVAMGQSGSASFSVTNTGGSATNLYVSASCTGTAIVGGACTDIVVANVLSYPDGWGNKYFWAIPGTPTTVTVSFNAASAVSTGRVRLVVKTGTNGTVLDTAWVDVSVAPPPTPIVTPDGTTQSNITPNSSASTSFVIRNPGSVTANYQFTVACTGLAIADECQQSLNSAWIAPGDSTTATVSYTAGGFSQTGRITLTAQSGLYAAAMDTGWVNLATTPGTPAIAVTPDGTNITGRALGTSGTQNFTVQNPGNGPGTFNFTGLCTGAAIASGCSVSPASATIAAGSYATVGITYTSSTTYAATGRVALTGTLSTNGAVKDSGWVNVTLVTAPTPTIFPDGATLAPYAANAASSYSFTVSNSGGTSGTFSFTAECSGAAVLAGCTPRQTSATIAAGSSAFIPVDFTTGGYGLSGGRVKLTATWSGTTTTSDTGWVNVSTLAAAAVAVTPDGQNGTVAPDTATSATFTVQNTGGSTGTFNFTAECTGSATACTPSLSSVAIPANGTVNVSIGYTPTGYGATGRVQLLARWAGDPTVRDTGWVNVTTKSTIAVVTPDGLAASPQPSAASSATFTVQNAGNTTASYSLALTCTGAAVSGCGVSPSTVSLAAGASSAVTANYTSGVRGTSGRLRLVATSTNHPALTDSGWVNVAIPANPAVAVGPDAATTFPLAARSGTSTQFSIQNTGDATDTYTLTTRCSGEGFSVGCAPSTNTVTLAPGASSSATVSYSTGEPGSAGRVVLLATSGLNPAVSDTGWSTFTVKPTYTIAAAPHGAVLVVPPNSTGRTVTFHAIPSATDVLYQSTITCSGAAIVGSCSMSPSGNPQASSTPFPFTVTFNTGAPGTTARLTFTTKIYLDQSIKDIAWIDIVAATPTAAAVAVSPDADVIQSVVPGAALPVPFVVSNTGNASATYTLSAVCSTPLTGSCTPAQSSVTLAPNAWATVPVNVVAGGASTVGRVALRAQLSTDAAVRDSGWVEVRTQPPAAVAALPDGHAISVPANGEAGVKFLLQNSGTVANHHVVDISCTGQVFATACTPQAISNLYLLPNSATEVEVNFNAGAVGSTGRIRLTLSLIDNPAFRDTAWVTLTAVAAPVVSVAAAPKATVVPIVPGAATSIPFSLQNTGSATTTYNLAVSCSGGGIAGACTLSNTSVTYGQGRTGNVTVSLTGGAAELTGLVKLIATAASNPAVKDSAWVTVWTGSSNVARPIAVLPDGNAARVPAGGTNAQIVFQIANPTGTTVTVDHTVACTGAAFIGACRLPSGTSVTIAAGSQAQVPVQFDAGAAGSTGRIRLVATSAGDPTASDSGWVDVTATSTSVNAVAVSPDNAPAYFMPGTAAAMRFVVQNVGTTASTYNYTAICEGTAVTAGCSATQPGSFAPGQIGNVAVNFTVGALGSTGRIRLVATSSTNPAVVDTGSVNVAVGSNGPVTVVVHPDGDVVTKAPNVGGFLKGITIHNNGFSVATFNLTLSCTGAAFLGCVPPSPATVTIPAGAAREVPVTYSTGPTSGATGRATLIATLASNPAVKDSGWFQVNTSTVTVTVTPDAQSLNVAPGGTARIPFTVANGGTSRETFGIASPRCTSTTAASILGSCSTTTTAVTLDPGRSQVVYVDYVAGLTAGATGRIALEAGVLTNGFAKDSGWVNVSVGTTAAALIVSSSNPTISGLTPGQPTTIPFQVSNPGNASGDYTVTVNCSWPNHAPGCTLAGLPSQPFTVGPGLSQSFSVGLTTGPAGTQGTISVTANLLGANAQSATATVTASTTAPTSSPVMVIARAVNAGTSIARDQCLTIAAGEDAAYECGDLRVVHTLPTTTTMGKARTPTLVYNSRHAKAAALIAADVKMQAGTTPTSLEVTVRIRKFAGPSGELPTPMKTFTWDPATPAGEARRIVMPIDGSGAGLDLPSGAYSYTFEVKAITGGSPVTGTDTGTVVIVNRERSPFGTGWWLDGLEELVVMSDTTRRLWVGGDGSTRVYARQGSSKWWMPELLVDRRDTLEVLLVNGREWFRRRLPNGAYVEFDSLLRHVATRNRQGHLTSFTWPGDQRLLTGITLPHPAGGRVLSYGFAYDSTPTPRPRLRTVTAPTASNNASRVVTINYGAGTHVASITDPIAAGEQPRGVGFVYNAAGRLIRRANRNGDSTFFAWDEAGLLARDSVLLLTTSEPPIVGTFCAAESRSLTSCASGPQRLDSVYTRFDGPRDNVADTVDVMRFHVNRLGAPETIVNAQGGITRIVHHATFPALPISVVKPNGFETRATYDPVRGLVDAVTAVNPLDDNRDATTRYTWHPSFDLVDSTKTHEGVLTRFGYDEAGNQRWREDNRGAASRVTFDYDSYNRLRFVRPPGYTDAQRQRLEYADSALGNLMRVTTSLGFSTEYATDAIGRDSVTRSPINTQGTLFSEERTTYDLRDLVKESSTIGPAMGTSRANTLQTARTSRDYDLNGNLIALRRWAEPTSDAATDLLETRWTYDAAGRVRTETAPDNAVELTVYDPAGNVIRRKPRHAGETIMTYTALNQLKTRATPAVSYGQESRTIQGELPLTFPRYGNGITIPADVATFTYDIAGAMRTANNGDAQVTRDYFPNGLLKSEEQRIRVYAPGVADFSKHQYLLGYTYDLDGRRTDLLRGGTNAAHYTYEAFGPLKTVENTAGLGPPSVITFGYDALGRLQTTQAPGGITETLTYDLDSRLTRRHRVGANFTRYLPSGNTKVIFDDTLTYDARSKVIRAVTQRDSSDFWYSGLGALTETRYTHVIDGIGRYEAYENDALGNLKHMQDDVRNKGYQYDRTAGRLDVTISHAGTDAEDLLHDAAGNVVEVGRTERYGSAVITSWAFSYYGADGKLRVADRQVLDTAYLKANGVPPRLFGSFEEYRYDALGRRVLRRVRRPECEGLCQSAIERFMWDGDQILMETRYPGGDLTPLDSLERYDGFVFGTECRDHPCLEDPPSPVDTVYSPYWGVMHYTYGAELDRPLRVVREFYGKGPYAWPVLVRFPYYDWRGNAAGATRLDGAEGETGVDIEWAGADTRMYRAYPITQAPPSWFGSVMYDKQDDSGLQYMRNRYYDPRTGQFTQEDPIGLAGGLNLYGFAAGDPVNLSDPFGLCPEEMGGDGKTKTLSDCPKDSQGWHQYRSGAVADAGWGDPMLLFGGLQAKGAAALPTGLRSASAALRSLFADGSVKGASIIGIRAKLLAGGFKQTLSFNKKGYRFTNELGEDIRIMSREGGWDIRIQNAGRNYLDEFGNSVRGKAGSHGITVYSR